MYLGVLIAFGLWLMNLGWILRWKSIYCICYETQKRIRYWYLAKWYWTTQYRTCTIIVPLYLSPQLLLRCLKLRSHSYRSRFSTIVVRDVATICLGLVRYTSYAGILEVPVSYPRYRYFFGRYRRTKSACSGTAWTVRVLYWYLKPGLHMCWKVPNCTGNPYRNANPNLIVLAYIRQIQPKSDPDSLELFFLSYSCTF